MSTPTTVSADQSKNLRLKFRKGEGKQLTFAFLVDSAAHDISPYTFLFQVFEIDGTTAVIELTEDSGGGLTNGGVAGTLVVDPTDDDLDIDEKTYIWKLKITAPHVATWFNGKFQVNNSPQDDVDADGATVELDLGDIIINVELTVAGFDVASLTDAQKAALATALAPYFL